MSATVPIISSTAIAISTGSRWAKRSWPYRKTGKVGSPPARKMASATSSNETMKQVSQAESSGRPHQRQDDAPEGGRVGGARGPSRRPRVPGRGPTSRASRIRVANGRAITLWPSGDGQQRARDVERDEEQEERDAQHDERHDQREPGQAEQAPHARGSGSGARRCATSSRGRSPAVAAPDADEEAVACRVEHGRVVGHGRVPVER